MLNSEQINILLDSSGLFRRYDSDEWEKSPHSDYYITTGKNKHKTYRENINFAKYPVKQFMRWLSSAFCLQIPWHAGEEVQCYFYADKREIIVSANKNDTNTELYKLLQGKHTLGLFLEYFLKKSNIKGNIRQEWHIEELKLFKEYCTSEEIWNIKITPIESLSYSGKDYDGLHAEARIAIYMAETEHKLLDFNMLGGRRAMCACCYLTLFPYKTPLSEEIRKSVDYIKRIGPYYEDPGAMAGPVIMNEIIKEEKCREEITKEITKEITDKGDSLERNFSFYNMRTSDVFNKTSEDGDSDTEVDDKGYIDVERFKKGTLSRIIGALSSK